MMTDKAMTMSVEQKAAMLANAIHLDYTFFENDLPPVYCRQSGDGQSVVIFCTLCQVRVTKKEGKKGQSKRKKNKKRKTRRRGRLLNTVFATVDRCTCGAAAAPSRSAAPSAATTRPELRQSVDPTPHLFHFACNPIADDLLFLFIKIK